MKLILAIVSGDDSLKVSKVLTKGGYFVTKLATTGGFLSAGNTTFLVGTQDDKVKDVVEIIGANSRARKQLAPSSGSFGVGAPSSSPIEVQVGGATVFVMNIEEFHKL